MLSSRWDLFLIIIINLLIILASSVNYGELLLKSLFEHWPRTCYHDDDDTGSNNGDVGPPNGHHHHSTSTPGNQYFTIPPHTPLIISEIQGRTLYRLLCCDAGGETEGMILQETVPSWVLDIVVEKTSPKPKNKVYFFLLPHHSSGIKRDKKLVNHDLFDYN